MTDADEFEAGANPRCTRCGTAMRDVNGGYECAWDSTRIDVPWVERPIGSDDLPSI